MDRLRFLHIPKTAGTTFIQVLKKQYPKDCFFEFSGNYRQDAIDFNNLPEYQKLKTKLFFGHAPYRTGIELADTAQTITLLRGPINRVKSFCQHVYEGKSQYLRDKFSHEKFDLDVFLNSGTLELSNLQTKMLLNTGASALGFKIEPSKAVDLALNNLVNELSAFGILEYFDESLTVFTQKFDWNIPEYKVSNTKNDKNLLEFLPHHIEKIKELNALDIQLFLKAKKLFLEQVNSKNFNKSILRKIKAKHTPLKGRFNQKIYEFKVRFF